MRRFPLAAMALAAGPALADGLPYEVFEAAVEHMDLYDCPSDLSADGVFCRATMASDGIHVFVFAEEGEQMLVTTRSYYDEEIAQVFGGG